MSPDIKPLLNAEAWNSTYRKLGVEISKTHPQPAIFRGALLWDLGLHAQTAAILAGQGLMDHHNLHSIGQEIVRLSQIAARITYRRSELTDVFNSEREKLTKALDHYKYA